LLLLFIFLFLEALIHAPHSLIYHTESLFPSSSFLR
jgi:maltodextrin utilization protein YvdJ